MRKSLPAFKRLTWNEACQWWQVALSSHYTFWKHDVHHRNISPGNLMSNGRWIGVINSMRWAERQGAHRNKYYSWRWTCSRAFKGKVPHLYWHDAESFFWVLVWVYFRYENGKLLSGNKPFDHWLKVDADRYREKRCHFQCMFRHGNVEDNHIKPSSSHQFNWKVAVTCLRTIFYVPQSYIQDDRSVFEIWLLTNVRSSLLVKTCCWKFHPYSLLQSPIVALSLRALQCRFIDFGAGCRWTNVWQEHRRHFNRFRSMYFLC